MNATETALAAATGVVLIAGLATVGTGAATSSRRADAAVAAPTVSSSPPSTSPSPIPSTSPTASTLAVPTRDQVLAKLVAPVNGYQPVTDPTNVQQLVNLGDSKLAKASSTVPAIGGVYYDLFTNSARTPLIVTVIALNAPLTGDTGYQLIKGSAVSVDATTSTVHWYGTSEVTASGDKGVDAGIVTEPFVITIQGSNALTLTDAKAAVERERAALAG